MGMWLLVNSIQAGIFAAAVIFGVVVLRLGAVQAAIAAALMMPAPIFQVAGGAGSWIYPSDLVAIFLLLQGLMNRPSPDEQFVRFQSRHLLLLATILVAIPIISTIIGVGINSQPREWKFVALQAVRSLGYLVVFRSMVTRGYSFNLERVLLLQILIFATVCLFGIAQRYLGVDLDLWNATVGRGAEDRLGGYGGGFMGLYRGAVGAWAVMMLGVAPLVLASRWGLNLLFPSVVGVIALGVLSVGSRQGLLIGVVAFAIGLIQVILTRPPTERAQAFAKASLACVLLLAILFIGWGRISGERLGTYANKRFSEIIASPSALLEAAWNRDPKIPKAFENVTDHADILTIGVGYGLEQRFSIDDGRFLQYVDSELFYMWQLGGTALLFVYLLFLAATRMRLRRANWPAIPERWSTPAAGIVILYGTIMLMWGHFSLLTTMSHHAPIGYWQWATIGMAVSFCGYRGPVEQRLMPQAATGEWR